MANYLDELFAYQTPKVVVIKDSTLGLLQLTLLLLIVAYVFGYTILYQGRHLQEKATEGVFQLSLRHPTEENCDPVNIGCRANFTSFSKLPYCAQSKLPYVTGDGKELTKGECQVWDAIESTIPLDQGIMIPTRIRRFDQVRDCEPSLENDWVCDGEPYGYLDQDGKVQTKPGKASAKYDAFVAGIERFTLLIDHGFSLPNVMKKDENAMEGFVLNCPDTDSKPEECSPTPITCVREKCLEGEPVLENKGEPALAEKFSGPGRDSETSVQPVRHTLAERSMIQVQSTYMDASTVTHAAEVAKSRTSSDSLPGGLSVVAAEKGDVFEVGALLKAAGVNLDSPGGFDEGTLRSRGLVLVISIEYRNKPASWAGVKINPFRRVRWPHYTYKISTRYAREYKISKTYDDPSNVQRSVRNYNGIRVVIEQRGRISMWDTTNALIVITASLGLLAVATTITEAMMFFMRRREEYKKLKFKESKDFHDEGSVEEHEQKTALEKDLGRKLTDVVREVYGKEMADNLKELLAAREKEKIEMSTHSSASSTADASSQAKTTK